MREFIYHKTAVRSENLFIYKTVVRTEDLFIIKRGSVREFIYHKTAIKSENLFIINPGSVREFIIKRRFGQIIYFLKGGSVTRHQVGEHSCTIRKQLKATYTLSVQA